MSPAAANPAFSNNLRQPFQSPTRLIVSDQSPLWHDVVIRRLQELVALEKGWDGYQAPPVHFQNAYFTLDMLRAICLSDMPAPQLVPGLRGDIQVEWHHPNGEIELHVKAPNSVDAWRRSPTAPEGEVISLTNDFVVVLSWIREMVGAPIGTFTAAA